MARGTGALLVLGGLAAAGIAYAVVQSRDAERDDRPPVSGEFDEALWERMMTLYSRCLTGQCSADEIDLLVRYVDTTLREAATTPEELAIIEALVSTLLKLRPNVSPPPFQRNVNRVVQGERTVGACCRGCDLGGPCEMDHAHGACCDECARGVGACACADKEPKAVGAA